MATTPDPGSQRQREEGPALRENARNDRPILSWRVAREATRQRRAAYVRGLGLLLALALTVLGLVHWNEAKFLQRRAQLGQAHQALQTLIPALKAWPQNEGLRQRMDELLYAQLPGFARLELRDRANVPVLVRGRYEPRGPAPGDALTQTLRRLRYAFHSYPASTLLQDAEGRIQGSVQFRLLRNVEGLDPALSGLRRAAVLEVLFGLAFTLGLGRVVWRQLFPPPDFRQRLDGQDERFTPRVAAAVAFDALHARLGRALDGVHFGLILVDRDARLRYMNASAEQLTGWPLSIARDRPVYSVFHLQGTEPDQPATPVEICLREGRDQPAHAAVLRARDGQERPIEVMACLLRDADGVVDAGALLFRDQSERQAEQEGMMRALRLAQLAADHPPDPLLLTDDSGTVRYANAPAQEVFGYASADLIGLNIVKLMPVPFLNMPQVQLGDYADSPPALMPKVVCWRQDASTFPARLRVQQIKIEGEIGYAVQIQVADARPEGQRATP